MPDVVKFRKTIAYHYSIAVAASILAVALTALFWETLRDAPFSFLFGAVALSAWQGGLLPGMLCSALSIILINLLLINPGGNLFATEADLLRFIIFAVVSGFISWLEEKRHHTQASLENLKRELEVILDSVTDGITAQDSTGRVVFANAASTELIGQSIQEPVGSTRTLFDRLSDSYHLIDTQHKTLSPADMPRNYVFKTGKSAETTIGLKSIATGKARWLHVRSAPVLDDNKNPRLAVNIFHDVTEERSAESERTENTRRLQNVIDSLAAFVGVVTLDGILIDANRAALEAANLTAEDVKGKHFADTYWWAYDAQLQAQLRDAIKRASKGERVRYDARVRVGEDESILIDFILAPTFDADGQVQFLVASGIDITARVKLTDQVMIQQRRLEVILNSLPGIVYEGTGGDNAAEQSMIFVSQYAETLLGYPMSEWTMSPNFWQKIVHPDDWETSTQVATETYHTGNPAPVPFRAITADGRILYLESYNAVITGLDGLPMGTCGLVLDVTERHRQEAEIKRLNEELTAQRERLERIISNVPGMVYEVMNAPERGIARMDYVSPFSQKMLGYAPEAWTTSENFWEQLVPSEEWDPLQKRTAELFASADSGVLQFPCVSKDGNTVQIEAHLTIIRDETNTPIGIAGVMMDITERRHQEEALAQYAEDLRRSNDELEQFAYVASHDLQEPLRMVTSYLQLVEQRYAEHLDDDGREFIGYAVDGATRMKTLINDLLTYSRIQRNKEEFEQVALSEVMDQVLHNLQLSIEDTGATITQDELPTLQANRMQMTQLFQNLIGNALKFNGGKTPQIHIGATREKNRWHFQVRDNGIGIGAAYLDRIFIIFQRLHARSEYEGTGIGLAICKKIVDKHGGSIHAESTPGEGTTFHFTLPVSRPKRRSYDGTDPNSVSGG